MKNEIIKLRNKILSSFLDSFLTRVKIKSRRIKAMLKKIAELLRKINRSLDESMMVDTRWTYTAPAYPEYN